MKKQLYVFVIVLIFIHIFGISDTFAQEDQSSSSQTDPGFGVQAPATPSAIADLASGGLSRRDPFSLPEYILIKIRQKNSEKSIATDAIDENSPPIVRWPLGSYQLVGIIWDVKKPKAMFLDRMKNVHIVKVNDFIGNLRGVVTKIQSGAVIVKEGQIPQVIKLNK